MHLNLDYYQRLHLISWPLLELPIKKLHHHSSHNFQCQQQQSVHHLLSLEHQMESFFFEEQFSLKVNRMVNAALMFSLRIQFHNHHLHNHACQKGRCTIYLDNLLFFNCLHSYCWQVLISSTIQLIANHIRCWMFLIHCQTLYWD